MPEPGECRSQGGIPLDIFPPQHVPCTADSVAVDLHVEPSLEKYVFCHDHA